MTRRKIERHVPERDWLALVAGDLPEPRLRSVRAHAAACSGCGLELASWLQLDALLAVQEPDDLDRTIVFDSPIGKLVIHASAAGICRVDFAESAASDAPARGDPLLERARVELEEYFAGRRRAFDLPIDLAGMGPFQRQVLEETARIGFGSLATYGRLAQTLGKPRAARAVGGALNRNPVPILIPCHRVVGSSGSLVGYAGGLAAKRFLLKLEGALAA